MYTFKDLDCGFVILCPDHSTKLVQLTARSIVNRYPGKPIVCVTDNSANTQDMKDLKAICPSYKGKGTFTSLINLGMKHAPAEWNFIIMAGSAMRPKLDQRFSYFIDSEKDILFPIADNRANFVDATLNGLFIHRKTFKEVGNWSENNPLEICKMMWALEAIEKGCKFKAIAGSKIC